MPQYNIIELRFQYFSIAFIYDETRYITLVHVHIPKNEKKR